MSGFGLEDKIASMCSSSETTSSSIESLDEGHGVINLKVAEAMKNFSSIHSKALKRSKRLIHRDLLPKVEANSGGKFREIAELESPKPKRNKKPQMLQHTPAIGNSDADGPRTDVIYRNPRFYNRRLSKMHPSLSQLDSTANRILWNRERTQFEFNLVLLKKSLFTLHLNRNNPYWKRYSRTSSHPAELVNPVPLDD